MYEYAESFVNGGPRLELFARWKSMREFWIQIGDEAIRSKPKMTTMKTEKANVVKNRSSKKVPNVAPI